MAWWGWALLGAWALLSVVGVRWLGAAAAVGRERERQARIDSLLTALDELPQGDDRSAAQQPGGPGSGDDEVSGGSPAAPRR
ncbi:hypothetical protein [Modestobacter sp. SYSU DS0511]